MEGLGEHQELQAGRVLERFQSMRATLTDNQQLNTTHGDVTSACTTFVLVLVPFRGSVVDEPRLLTSMFVSFHTILHRAVDRS